LERSQSVERRARKNVEAVEQKGTPWVRPLGNRKVITSKMNALIRSSSEVVTAGEWGRIPLAFVIVNKNG
jgi:hypothetical protein